MFISRENLTTVFSGLQTFAALGMLIVSVVGLLMVSPIITYQIEYQEKRLEGLPVTVQTSSQSNAADNFINVVIGWWKLQIDDLEQVEQIHQKYGVADNSVKLTFIDIEGNVALSDDDIAFIEVKVIDNNTVVESAKIPVNSHAERPYVYIQRMIEEGVLDSQSELLMISTKSAIEAYLERDGYMLNKVPSTVSFYVNLQTNLAEIAEDIRHYQEHRRTALKQLSALKGIVDAVQAQQTQ